MKRTTWLALVLVLGIGCEKATDTRSAVEGTFASSARTTEQNPPRPTLVSSAPTAEETPRKSNCRVIISPAAEKEIKATLQSSGAKYLSLGLSAQGKLKLDLTVAIGRDQELLGEFQGIPTLVTRIMLPELPPEIAVNFIDRPGQRGFSIPAPPQTSVSLAWARMGFKTKLTREERGGKPAPQPPADVFQLVHYEAAPGKLAAYLTLDPQDGNKHPAIVWITGGDCNSIDQGCWKEGPRANDQSAAAYRKAGLVMMFPSLRGGNDNPGVKEGFLGEVDDVIAAANFLAKQPFVDPNRIYLGGQSTGGTLALLTAEYTDRFRAVFCFGPGCNVLDYGKSFTPFPTTDLHELAVRAPVLWLHSVRKPTFIFEGSEGNGDALRELAKESTNPKVHCFEVKGVDHFAVLAPTNELIAEKLLKDSGPTCDLAFTAEELNQAVKK